MRRVGLRACVLAAALVLSSLVTLYLAIGGQRSTWRLPATLSIDEHLANGPAVGLVGVWANGSHAALCDTGSMQSSVVTGEFVHCTAFLRRLAVADDSIGDTRYVPWPVLRFHRSPGWVEALTVNADIIAAAAAGRFSELLPSCTTGMLPGVTLASHYDKNIYFHVIMRGLWWQHRYGVGRLGGAAAARAVASAVTASATRLRGAQPLIPEAAISERDALRAAAVDAAGIDALWLQMDSGDPEAPPRVDPRLGVLLEMLARSRAPGDGESARDAPRTVHCFETLVPSFTGGFGVETSKKWTREECVAEARNDDVPLFVSHLRAALGVPPPLSLVALPALCTAVGPVQHPTRLASNEPTWRLPISQLCSSERPLLVARRTAGVRVISNEGELIAGLRAAGAVVVAAALGGDEWPAAAQAEAATRACGIVGLHGSALTNLIFLAPHDVRLRLPRGVDTDVGLHEGGPACAAAESADIIDAGSLPALPARSNATLRLPGSVSDALGSWWGSRKAPLIPPHVGLMLAPPLIELFPHILPEELADGGEYRIPQLAVFHNLACAAHVPYAAYVAPTEPGVEPRSYLGLDVRARPATVDVDAVVDLVVLTLERSLSVLSPS